MTSSVLLNFSVSRKWKGKGNFRIHRGGSLNSPKKRNISSRCSLRLIISLFIMNFMYCEGKSQQRSRELAFIDLPFWSHTNMRNFSLFCHFSLTLTSRFSVNVCTQWKKCFSFIFFACIFFYRDREFFWRYSKNITCRSLFAPSRERPAKTKAGRAKF